MLWFYRRAFSLLFVLALILIIIRVVGGARPGPLGILLTNPDGSSCMRPCVFGIQPSKTSAVEAIALLKAHPLTRTFQVTGENPYTVSKGLSSVAFSEASDGLVDSVFVMFNPSFDQNNPGAALSPTSLGDVVAEYGSPDLVKHLDNGIYMVNVHAQTLFRVNLGTSGEVQLKTSMPLRSFVTFRMPDCPLPPFIFALAPWLGFQSTSAYHQAAALAGVAESSVFEDTGHIFLKSCPPQDKASGQANIGH